MHALVKEGLNNLGRWYADDIFVAHFTTRKLQKNIDLVHKYCRR
jgi:hypothetical protein